MDLGSFKREMDRQMSGSEPRMQVEVVKQLIGQVQEFVNKTKEQEKLVHQIPELNRKAQMTPKTDAETKEKEEASRLLHTAQQLESTVRSRKQHIEKLRHDVEMLLRSF